MAHESKFSASSLVSSVLSLKAKTTNNGLSATRTAKKAMTRDAALQSTILLLCCKVLPYKIVEHQSFSVRLFRKGNNATVPSTNTIKGGADLLVVMFDLGSNFSVFCCVTLKQAGDFSIDATHDASTIKASLWMVLPLCFQNDLTLSFWMP